MPTESTSSHHSSSRQTHTNGRDRSDSAKSTTPSAANSLARQKAFRQFVAENPFEDPEDFNKLWDDDLGMVRHQRGSARSRGSSFGVGSAGLSLEEVDQPRDLSLLQLQDLMNPFTDELGMDELRPRHLDDITLLGHQFKNGQQEMLVEQQKEQQLRQQLGQLHQGNRQGEDEGELRAPSSMLEPGALTTLSEHSGISLALSDQGLSVGSLEGEHSLQELLYQVVESNQHGEENSPYHAEQGEDQGAEEDMNMDDGWEDIIEDEMSSEQKALTQALEGDEQQKRELEEEDEFQTLAREMEEAEAEERAEEEKEKERRARELEEEERERRDLEIEDDQQLQTAEMEEGDLQRIPEPELENDTQSPILETGEDGQQRTPHLEEDAAKTDGTSPLGEDVDMDGVVVAVDDEEEQRQREPDQGQEQDQTVPPQDEYEDGYMNLDEDHIEHQEHEEQRGQSGVQYFDDFPSELGIMSNGTVLPTAVTATKKKTR